MYHLRKSTRSCSKAGTDRDRFLNRSGSRTASVGKQTTRDESQSARLARRRAQLTQAPHRRITVQRRNRDAPAPPRATSVVAACDVAAVGPLTSEL